MSLAELFWTASYAIAFFGSISFGYLILRFSMPDIRAKAYEQKLGLSGLVGAVLFASSFSLSIVIPVFSFLFFLPVTAFVLSAFFEARNTFFGNPDMEVAVPVARVEPKIERIMSEKTRKAFAKTTGYDQPRVIQETKITEKGVEITRPSVLAEKKSREAPMSERKRHYLERRGVLVEAAREDMMRAAETTRPEEEAKRPLEISRGEVSIEEVASGLDVSELERISSVGELESLGDFGEASSIGLLEKMELGEVSGLSQFEKVPKEKGMACPKCGSSKGMMVYCPYDGKGFCANCADKVEAKQDLLLMGCPHCKKEVIVKKP